MPRRFQLVRCALSCVLVGLAARAAAGQQFQEQVGLLPVPANYWTEAVAAVDADEDGRWDVLFVHANGWAVPGDFQATGSFPLPPLLLVNTATAGGNPVFEDRSAQYLPAGLEVHGKSASVSDFDGDGHDDVLIGVAFGGIQRLLIKQPDTLAWHDESDRLPELHISSYGAGIGDFDDDGDMDIVFSDAARPTFGPPGGQARLCLNDGAGHFSESDGLAATDKVGAQNIRVADIDNDFDLDVIVDGKSRATQLFVNDGNAQFRQDDGVIPAAENWTYETEWGDLDNDLDIDGVMISYAFFSEGALENRLGDTGTLAFRGSKESMTGLPPDEFEDDNESVFVDVDDDGDLDVIVASLQHTKGEKLYVNSGTFGPGFLHVTPGQGFSTLKDSTLDLLVADFDGDGDNDAITGQGESFNFTDRYYRNTGPADTQPPFVGRVEPAPPTVPLELFAAGRFVRHAWIQDSTWDDGWTFVEARLRVDVLEPDGTCSATWPMAHSGGQVFRGAVRPPDCARELLGKRVSYRVVAGDPNGNSTLSRAQTFVVCGSESFGAQGPIRLDVEAEPRLGASLVLRAVGGPPGRAGLLAVGSARRPGSAVLVDPAGTLLVPLRFDAAGSARIAIPLPDDAALAGRKLVLQVSAGESSSARGAALSNALEVALCAP